MSRQRASYVDSRQKSVMQNAFDSSSDKSTLGTGSSPNSSRASMWASMAASSSSSCWSRSFSAAAASSSASTSSSAVGRGPSAPDSAARASAAALAAASSSLFRRWRSSAIALRRSSSLRNCARRNSSRLIRILSACSSATCSQASTYPLQRKSYGSMSYSSWTTPSSTSVVTLIKPTARPPGPASATIARFLSFCAWINWATKKSPTSPLPAC
mmetsp:Transcript_9490/g.21729  ORF Transcript_9490/g.21729 Transcript_9490/m.21729 type:complete len:214 (+) Transcript_9490:2731-3372(+)